LAIAGFIFALAGAGLAIAGFTSSTTLFYRYAGAGLIVSGVLLARRKAAGAWIYLAVFAATVIWSLGNAGSTGSSLAYRLIGPTTLLAMIAIVLPALGRRTPRQTVALFTGLMIVTITIGLIFTPDAGASQ